MRREVAGANFIDLFQFIDVGGGDRGPCFPAMPRGCVVCVVCRARTCRSQHCCGFVSTTPKRGNKEAVHVTQHRLSMRVGRGDYGQQMKVTSTLPVVTLLSPASGTGGGIG